MAPLFSKADLIKFWYDVQYEMTLICAKFDKDLFSISKVIGRKTKWPRFLAYPVRPVGLRSQSLDWYWQTKRYRKINKLNTTQKSKQHKIRQYSTSTNTLVQSLLMTLGQETRRAYSTTLPNPHGDAQTMLNTVLVPLKKCKGCKKSRQNMLFFFRYAYSVQTDRLTALG